MQLKGTVAIKSSSNRGQYSEPFLHQLARMLNKNNFCRLTWQTEIGLMKREEILWIPKKPDCNAGKWGFTTVDVNVIKPPIILLLLGYALSILIALVERLSVPFKKIAKNRC